MIPEISVVPGLPKLPPSVSQRPRIMEWFARNSALPLRILSAPPGTGKTAAIAAYLPTRERTAYVGLKDDDTPELLRERLAAVLGIERVPESYDALLAALAPVAPREIAIDDVDRPTQEAREELAALAIEAPPGITLIYGCRSRAALDAGRLVASGLAAALDGRDLALDAEELERLCDAHAVTYASADVTRLLEETDGWPIVVAWVVRTASEAGAPLGGAYERWRKANGRHFSQYVAGELQRAGGDARAAFRSALRGKADDAKLSDLEMRGVFVVPAEHGFAPYRVVRTFETRGAPAQAPQPSEEPVPPMTVRMFGRFEAEISGRRIEWVRRREAQIFKYLLLKPGGSASRAELLETFWPGADGHLATQSIRSACSNIRKAIASIVGYANVERYFSSRGQIEVSLAHTVIDVRRFTAHVADGDAELERGRGRQAFAHYRAADALYIGELLSGDYPEPWYAPRAEMFKSLYIGVLERLVEFYAESGQARRAADCAERLARLRTETLPLPASATTSLSVLPGGRDRTRT